MPKLLRLLPLLLISVTARAQQIPAATLERVVSVLAADSLTGRASGTPGLQKAARFLAAEFKRIGLQPLPGAAGFEQTFTAWRAYPLTAQATVGGAPVAAGHVLVIPGQERIAWAPNTPDAPRVVVVGPADNPRAAFRTIRRPTENVLILLDTAHRKTLAQLAAAADHFTMRAEPPTFSTAIVLTPAPGVTTPYQLTASARIAPVPMANVVGYLPGRQKARAREFVVFSAHYDHLGYLPAVAGDSIANGADDDASGTAAVVALAEHFSAGRRPARPLIFVAFAAEEVGGFGSQYFSRQLKPAEIVAMFNIEMIGKEAEAGPGSAYITGYEKSSFGDLLNASLKQSGRAGASPRFIPDPYPEQQLFYRSDNATLARLGVPAHTISTSRMPADKLYHSVDDEVETLQLTNLTAVVESIARSATGIVSGKHTPSRVTDSGERK